MQVRQLWILNTSDFLQSIKRESEIFEACKEIDFLLPEEKENLSNSFWTSENYKFSPVKPFSRNVVSIWQHNVFKSNVQIIFCGLNGEAWEFDRIADAVLLFNAIECFVEKIGVLPSFPIRTTQKIFEKTVKRDFPVLSNNPLEYFAPFLEKRDDTLITLRDLEATERKAKYLFAFDKRSMFLNVCSGLEFGENEYETVENVSSDNLLVGLYDVQMVWKTKINKPLFQNYYQNGDYLLYSPTLELFSEFADIKIKRGYIFRETHRTFEKFYKLISKAKKETSDSEFLAVRSANSAIKSLYTDFFGFLRKRENAESEYAKQWFRPDWRGLIIAQANADLLRNAYQVQQKTGKKPFAILHDCLMYAADDISEFAETCLIDSNKFSFEWKLDRTIVFDDLGKAKMKLAEIDKRGKENAK
jgi:hypothetical protein